MIHAGPRVAAIALAVALAMTGALAQTQTESASRTFWDHNGSVMYLVANGASREFYYQKPRPGMLDAGARPGSLLFRGELNNGEYEGTAYIFNPLCGPIPFAVKGSSRDDDDRIVLTGEAPRVGRNCRTHASFTSTLEFRRANLDDGANRSQEATPALPPSIASKPELKPDVSPAQAAKISPPTAQQATRTETLSVPQNSSQDLVDSTAVRTSTSPSSVSNETQANHLNKYLVGAAFIVMTVWLLIKVFGRTLIGLK